jgi:GTP pyrophosphokinase
MQPSEVVPSSPSLPGPIPAPNTPANALEQRFAELLARVRELRPNEDVAPIEKAYRIASEAHAKQSRASGEPYISHPLEVAFILADMQMDNVCVLTGLLHDTVEDTGLTVDSIRREFGDEVARCVDKTQQVEALFTRGPASRERP